jgi:hypothetical protein
MSAASTITHRLAAWSSRFAGEPIALKLVCRANPLVDRRRKIDERKQHDLAGPTD